MNTPTSEPAPILELPDELDDLDALYRDVSQRGDHVTCWLITNKVRRCHEWLPPAEFYRWRERSKLSFTRLTEEERNRYQARI